MVSQRFIGSPQVFGTSRIGQTGLTELQKLQIQQSQAVTRAMTQGPEAIAAAAGKMNTLLTQQAAADLQAAEAAASKLWWSQNWPLLAGGAAALGLVGYLAFGKK